MTANAGPRARAPDKAKAPALKLEPGGHATAVERDSEKGATWEVEGRKTDGSIVDLASPRTASASR